MAKRCLAGLDPNAERFAFQFRKPGCKPFDIVCASFEELWSTVLARNTPTEGVEVFVKATDTAGRPLALFAVANGYEQIDAASAVMQTCGAKSNMIVGNARRLQICYVCNGIPSDLFPTLQKTLGAKLGIESAVTDLLPLPGTLDLANPKAPRLVELFRNGAGERWNFDDLANKLGLPGNGADPDAIATPQPSPATNGDSRGGTNGPLTVSADPTSTAEAVDSVVEPVLPAPDRDQLDLFVRALFKHATPGFWLSLRAFLEKGAGRPRITPIQLSGGLKGVIDLIYREVELAARAPQAVVFCPPIATFSNGGRAREIDLAEGLALSVECDAHARAARAKLEALLGPATAVVASGGEWTDPEASDTEPKLHLHYRLKAPTRSKEEHQKLKLARKLAAKLVGGDPSNVPLVHPIRWPGSLHRKGEPKLCRIIELNPDAEIDLDAAVAHLQKAASDEAPAGRLGPVAPAFRQLGASDDLAAGITYDRSPRPFAPIKAGCAWLREVHDTGGKDESEVLWWDALRIGVFLEDRDKLIHEFGNKHPEYDSADTEKKFDHVCQDQREKDLGWPLCKTIQDHGCKHCETCPHLANGGSPLHLGLPQAPSAALQLPAELLNMLHLVGNQPVGHYKTRGHLLWAFIHTARRRGVDENIIVDACLDETYRGCAIYEQVRENGGEDYVKRQIEAAINSDPLLDERKRSIIRIEEGKLDEHWRAVSQG
jgi:hypothetical protein